MTNTEAADLILSEADAPPMDWYLPEVRDAILAAVATVMDAAWADAFRDAADICGTLAETIYDDADGFAAALGCEAAICRRAKPNREPKT